MSSAESLAGLVYVAVLGVGMRLNSERRLDQCVFTPFCTCENRPARPAINS